MALLIVACALSLPLQARLQHGDGDQGDGHHNEDNCNGDDGDGDDASDRNGET